VSVSFPSKIAARDRKERKKPTAVVHERATDYRRLRWKKVLSRRRWSRGRCMLLERRRRSVGRVFAEGVFGGKRRGMDRVGSVRYGWRRNVLLRWRTIS
jgi:hypothetical protein